MHGTIVITREQDILRAVGEGMLTPEDIDRAFTGTKETVDAERRVTGQVRLLVDLREFLVQSLETVERMRQWNMLIHAEEDRVAFLVASALLKGQMRRIQLGPNQQVFDSDVAARAWLRSGAGDHALPAMAS